MSTVIDLLDDSDENDDEVVLISQPQTKRRKTTPANFVDLESSSRGIEDDPYESLHTRMLEFFPGLTADTFQRIRAQHDRLVSAGTALPTDFEKFAINAMAGLESSSASPAVGQPFSARKVLRRLQPMFPLVDAEYARDLIHKAKMATPDLSIEGCVQMIALKLAEEKDYKKVERKKEKKVSLPERDFRKWKDAEVMKRWENSDVYKEEACVVLADAFQRVPMRVINRFMKSRNCFYYPTKLRLQQEMDSIHLLARKRSLRVAELTHPELVREVKWEESYERSKQEKRDAEAAVKLHDERAEKESTAIECGCCYTDRAFENMIQCTEGHLFCRDCLKHYAQERLFGSGATGLKCMDTAGCTGKFVRTQLERALPKKVLEKWEQAEARECVEKLKNSSAVAGLFTCPHCDTVSDVPDSMQVVVCPNEACGKEVCKKCRRESHIPLRCDEVFSEEKETAGRISIEEKMTEVRLRQCPKCSTKFFKTEGCNRMLCRCGTSMCYVCRKANVSYAHFHGKCSLHSGGSVETDMAAVVAAGEKAKKELLAKANGGAKERLAKMDIAKLGNETSVARRGNLYDVQRRRAAANRRRAGGGGDVYGLGLQRVMLNHLAGMQAQRAAPMPLVNNYVAPTMGQGAILGYRPRKVRGRRKR